MSGQMENKSIISPTSALSKLSIGSQLPEKHTSKDQSGKNPEIISESWEDDIVSSDDEHDECSISSHQLSMFPSAPPPTPISPSTKKSFDNLFDYNVAGISNTRNEHRNTLRPDKTDAVARRLIAGALGVKPSPKTEEQKAYEAAMKGREIKRRTEDRKALAKALEDAERSKQAIWSD